MSPDLFFVNADLYEQSSLQHIADPHERSTAARLWADAERSRLLTQGLSFASETVFSHESKLQLIEQAVAAGFLVALYVVALDDPNLLVQRVKQRVMEGGHDVPAERILARYPRTLANLKIAVQLASVSYVYDSLPTKSHGDPALELVAVIRPSHRSEKVLKVSQKNIRWVTQLLGE
jgi:predicted ABC-type ATPase